jgi:hypothetical protein
VENKIEKVTDESGEVTNIVVEGGSKLPDTVDESKIPEGKDPQVFDQSTGMNMRDLPERFSQDDMNEA